MISASIQDTNNEKTTNIQPNETHFGLLNDNSQQLDSFDKSTAPLSDADQQYFDQWLASQLSSDNFGAEIPEYLSPAAVMQSNATPSAQFTGGFARNPHQRESSLSSLGSIGPASPYAHNTTNPQIAVTDSSIDNFHGMHQGDSNAHSGLSYYQMSKPEESFNMYNSFDPNVPDMAYPVAVPGPQRPRNDRGLLPAPEVRNRSRPVSVASSNAGDSPATPNTGESEHQTNLRRRGRQTQHNIGSDDNSSRLWSAAYGNVPKLDRTMTDVYGDELYSPNFTIISSSPTHSQTATSPSSQIFTQRINAANSQHLNAAHSPASTTSRVMSPFRASSPFVAPHSNNGVAPSVNQGAFNATQQMREQQHMQAGQSQTSDVGTPKTISPKDAVLEFGETDGNNFSLFPQDSTPNFDFDHLGKMMGSDNDDASRHFGMMRSGNESQQSGFSQLSMDNRIPQQYPFVPRMQPAPQHLVTPRLSSTSSSSVETDNSHLRRGKPAGVAADGGTYTCTYHGCTMRFESPAQLQKHKRDGHRQTQTLGIRSHDNNATNTQAGPHRCDRINPSTGKPCQSIFSRPYDLTRHEDTIHNARKLKVRCDICTEEKTFSRADALTRHYRVCHPEMELPGKHRRRGT